MASAGDYDEGGATWGTSAASFYTMFGGKGSGISWTETQATTNGYWVCLRSNAHKTVPSHLSVGTLLGSRGFLHTSTLWVWER